MVSRSVSRSLQRAEVELLPGVVAGAPWPRAGRRARWPASGRPRPARTPRRRGRRRGRRRSSRALGDLLDASGERVEVVEADVAQRDVRAAPAPARSGAGWRSRASRRSWGTRRRGRRRRAGCVTTSPAPVSTSISSTDSCGRPLRNEVDSMPRPGDRAAEGDASAAAGRRGDQAVRQGGVDEVLVGAHALDVGGAAPRGTSTATTPASPDTSRPGASVRGPGAEQVRGPLGQPDRRPGRDRVVGRAQPCHRLDVGVPPHHIAHGDNISSRCVAPVNRVGW